MSFPANVIPVFGSQRAYADLNFSGGSFGLDGRIVNDLTALPGFTFTRASLAMGYDATGKLTYGPNNLALQSQTFGTGWTINNVGVTGDTVVAPDGTLTADTLTAVAGGGGHYLFQSATFVAGNSIFSLYVKYTNNRWFTVRLYNSVTTYFANFDLLNGVVGSATAGVTSSISSVGGGWYRLSALVSFAATGTGNVVLCLNNSDTLALTSWVAVGNETTPLWGAQLEAVTYQTTPSTYYPTTTAAYYGPRLVYDPVTLASLGILVEEARTNLCLQSQTFDNASWSKNGSSPVSVTSNSAIAPDGTLTADTLTGDNANADRVQQTITTTASAPYNFSVFLKNVNATASALTTTATSPLQITVTWTGADITAITQTNGTGTYRSVGNGWWRVDGQFTLGASDTAVVFRIYPSYAGSGAKSVYAWQAQIEAGTGASSPIPTTTASVTRAADVAAVTGLSVPTPLSLVSSGGMTAATATTRYMAQVDAGSSANIVLNYLNTANLRRCFVQTASVTQADISVSSAVAVGDQWTIASRFQTDNVRLSTAGVLGTADTSATMPTGLANLRIGTDGAGGQFNGTISRIRIYNRALSDAQLQSLTS